MTKDNNGKYECDVFEPNDNQLVVVLNSKELMKKLEELGYSEDDILKMDLDQLEELLEEQK